MSYALVNGSEWPTRVQERQPSMASESRDGVAWRAFSSSVEHCLGGLNAAESGAASGNAVSVWIGCEWAATRRRAMSGFYLPISGRQRKHAESLAVLEAEGKGFQQASPGAFSEGTAPVTEAIEPSPFRPRSARPH